ncbi:PLP-dependent aminotransferase family protein [Brevibacillus choshinensis]|uniref:PLP-dependent aminotransferase family protein n=1 Tax=Brevibacillus choshinensis TaxID=54911 RepID=A0ABX7FPC2_BRECH|nr:PLP-dependent aminotransferase family protein [Brevibacillus choshinensis]QRG66835.1 PLP-dependent aminotransferase family protein [Brevibacillus choshinensis]
MQYPFTKRVSGITSSAVRDLLKVIQSGNIISFAGGLPDEALFPVQELELAYQKVFRSGGKYLQYGPTEGDVELRTLIQERLRERAIPASLENILVTTGSQQAIDLLAKVFLSAGDTVLVENPSYLAALQAFQLYEANMIAVQSDHHGMIPEDLEEKIITHSPKFIYVVPTFSNPEGKVWSKERREALLQLAAKHNVIVVEDDPYSDLRFTDEQPVPLAGMEADGAHVIYTSTFSKTVAPGVRIGWLTGPKEVIRMSALSKQSTDLHTSSIDQRALYYFLQDFPIRQHVERLREQYKHRLQVMQRHLSREGQNLFEWAEPQGGMFLWVSMKGTIDASELLEAALQEGVAFVPGASFFVGQPERNTLRLNYTHAAPEVIEAGMARLMTAIDKVVASSVNGR